MSEIVYKESSEIEINILSLLKELLRKWYIIVVAVACFAVLLTAFSFVRADRRYSSTASAYLLSKTDRSTAITTAELSASATLAADFAQIIVSTDTIKETISRLDLSVPVDSLKKSVTSSFTTGNRIVTIVVKDRSAELAQRIAKTLLEVADEKATAISKTLYVEIVDEPNLPTSVSRPGLKSPFIKGALLGFVLSCIYIIICWFVKKPIWDESDMEDSFKAPSLGSLSID